MVTPSSKALVIDTDIARASGGQLAVFPTSKKCRDFLMTVLEVCHQLVGTEAISSEWKRHRSRFVRRWLRQMDGRKKVMRVSPQACPHLRQRIQQSKRSEADKPAMLKDMILIEAALATDLSIISLDDTARDLFASTSENVRELQHVAWVNPANESEKPVAWLEGGAKPENQRMLGFWSEAGK